jgi:formate dehydrogenase subunit beta
MVDKARLHEEVKKVLESPGVHAVIGYADDACGLQAVPFFAKTTADVQRLTFSAFCVNNLAMYLKNYDGSGKLGVLVKGCDCRSVIQLLTEKRITREKLLIIGIPCDGVIDEKKLREKFPRIASSKEVTEKGDVYVMTVDGNTCEVPKKDLVLEKCLHCAYPTPLLYDVLLGEKKQPWGKEEYTDVTQFEKKSLEEKWQFWEGQFDRCIRCYACRNICPVCYCKECAAEQLNPQWLRRSVNLSENTVWHLTRAMHVAGRCTECGECERVCPMNIPLMLLNKKLSKEVLDLFSFTPGVSLEEKPLLASFRPDDPEECVM